jgi:hypothetical protein
VPSRCQCIVEHDVAAVVNTDKCLSSAELDVM